MAIEITVPRLGWSMEEGIFGDWFKRPGEFVAVGEPLYSLESDKVTMDVEALDAGILYLPVDTPAPGGIVQVGQLLGYLLKAGEAPPASRRVSTPAPVAALPALPALPAPRPADDSGRITASPRARAAARRLGIDLATVSPRPGRARIIASDLAKAKAPAARAALAARLEESVGAPHFYLHADADAEALVAYREAHRPVSYNDILLHAISTALTRHPRVNAYWEKGELRRRTSFHVALAAQIGDSLLTPVIRNPAHQHLAGIAADREAILERCRRHQATPADFADASATLSNLGPFGVDRFQAILNPPQSIIVAAGSLKKRPVAVGNAVVARLTLPLSLSVDHRVVDGVAAAAFLQTLVELLERLASGEPSMGR